MCLGSLFSSPEPPAVPVVEPIEPVEQPTPVDAGSTARKQEVKRKALAAAQGAATNATGPGGLLDPATLGASSLLGSAARV